MKLTLLTLTALACVLSLSPPGNSQAGGKDERTYEMRIYNAAPGRLADLQARFRDHTCKLFEKHGMTNVGYFVPVDPKDNRLIYFMSYPSVEAREKSWKTFAADPDWKKAFKESEAMGSLAKGFETLYMKATDFSPVIKPSQGGERVFEMRTYTTTKGNLDALNARFRDHTCKLFEKHGMTNIAYWVPQKGKKGADNTLIYILAHKSVEAGKASFEAFRNDPQWQEALKASEAKAGGSLTVKDGVKSVFMKATDFSPIK